jgi:hypothetical protein
MFIRVNEWTDAFNNLKFFNYEINYVIYMQVTNCTAESFLHAMFLYCFDFIIN